MKTYIQPDIELVTLNTPLLDGNSLPADVNPEEGGPQLAPRRGKVYIPDWDDDDEEDNQKDYCKIAGH